MMRKFAADASGLSAIEFGIVTPIFAFVIIGILEGWSFATSVLGARTAVYAGENYVMQGGTEENAIRSVALSTWENRPEDGDVTVKRYCECSGAVVMCGGLCSVSQKPPEAFIEISAAGTWESTLQTRWFPVSRELGQRQVIRVR